MIRIHFLLPRDLSSQGSRTYWQKTAGYFHGIVAASAVSMAGNAGKDEKNKTGIARERQSGVAVLAVLLAVTAKLPFTRAGSK